MGSLLASAGYHRRMKEVCEAHHILYVSDEVVTAFGRLGHFFASKDRFDVMPDMIVTAKGITSGYMPLAATLVSDRIFDAIAQRPDGALLTHGFTYSGHAVACAVAIANIDVMEREDLCARVRSNGPYFEERLKTLDDLPIVGDVRGSHFMLCVESVRDRTSKEPFAADANIGRRIAQHAQSRGGQRPGERIAFPVENPPLRERLTPSPTRPDRSATARCCRPRPPASRLLRGDGMAGKVHRG